MYQNRVSIIGFVGNDAQLRSAKKGAHKPHAVRLGVDKKFGAPNKILTSSRS